MKIYCLDFECANTYAYYSICWMGLIKADDSLEPVDIISRKFDPSVKSFFTGKITFPFTLRELKREPTFAKAHRILTDVLDDNTLVIGHALYNDICMLLSACDKFKIPCPEFNYIDTNVLYSVYTDEFKDTALKTVADEFGIEFGEHDPAEDARATLAIVKALCEREECDLDGLLKKYGVILGRVRDFRVSRCYSLKASEKTVYKYRAVNETNRFIDNYERSPKRDVYGGRSFYIEQNAMAQFDLRPLLSAMLDAGCVIKEPEKICDLSVKLSDRVLEDNDSITYKQLYEHFGMRFSLPAMLRKDCDFEYCKGVFSRARNEEKYARFKAIAKGRQAETDTFKGKRVYLPFDLADDENMLLIVRHNGKYTPYSHQAAYVVTDDEHPAPKLNKPVKTVELSALI